MSTIISKNNYSDVHLTLLNRLPPDQGLTISCIGCLLVGPINSSTDARRITHVGTTEEAAVEHLNIHTAAGHKVPHHAFFRLQKYMREKANAPNFRQSPRLRYRFFTNDEDGNPRTMQVPGRFTTTGRILQDREVTRSDEEVERPSEEGSDLGAYIRATQEFEEWTRTRSR